MTEFGFPRAAAMTPGNYNEAVNATSKASYGQGNESPNKEMLARPAGPGERPYIAGRDPDLWLYRERTLAMLRRYYRFSVEVGRLPSLLGRELFRTRITSYRAGTFEDAVIFVHDVARGLAKLDAFDHKLIAKIVLQDYTHNETARLLGCWRRTVGRRFPEALDQLTDIFLEAGLLVRLPAADVAREKICQEGENGENPVSDSRQWE